MFGKNPVNNNQSLSVGSTENKSSLEENIKALVMYYILREFNGYTKLLDNDNKEPRQIPKRVIALTEKRIFKIGGGNSEVRHLQENVETQAVDINDVNNIFYGLENLKLYDDEGKFNYDEAAKLQLNEHYGNNKKEIEVTFDNIKKWLTPDSANILDKLSDKEKDVFDAIICKVIADVKLFVRFEDNFSELKTNNDAKSMYKIALLNKILRECPYIVIAKIITDFAEANPTDKIFDNPHTCYFSPEFAGARSILFINLNILELDLFEKELLKEEEENVKKIVNLNRLYEKENNNNQMERTEDFLQIVRTVQRQQPLFQPDPAPDIIYDIYNNVTRGTLPPRSNRWRNGFQYIFGNDDDYTQSPLKLLAGFPRKNNILDIILYIPGIIFFPLKNTLKLIFEFLPFLLQDHAYERMNQLRNNKKPQDGLGKKAIYSASMFGWGSVFYIAKGIRVLARTALSPIRSFIAACKLETKSPVVNGILGVISAISSIVGVGALVVLAAPLIVLGVGLVGGTAAGLAAGALIAKAGLTVASWFIGSSVSFSVPLIGTVSTSQVAGLGIIGMTLGVLHAVSEKVSSCFGKPKKRFEFVLSPNSTGSGDDNDYYPDPDDGVRSSSYVIDDALRDSLLQQSSSQESSSQQPSEQLPAQQQSSLQQPSEQLPAQQQSSSQQPSEQLPAQQQSSLQQPSEQLPAQQQSSSQQPSEQLPAQQQSSQQQSSVSAARIYSRVRLLPAPLGATNDPSKGQFRYVLTNQFPKK